MTTHLTNLVRAGYGSIFITTFEEDRVVNDLVAVAKQLNYEVWSWSITEGLKNGKQIAGTEDPLKMLNAFAALEDPESEEDEPQGKIVSNKSLVILKDFHAFLRGTPNPMLVRRFKECIASGRATNRHLIILGCQLHLPPELEKEIVVVEFSLPTREELKVVAEGIAESVKQELNGNSDAILDAGSGLTTTEFADACAYSVAEAKQIEPAVISRIKSDSVKKNGVLELVNLDIDLSRIGGYQVAKSWLLKRVAAFSKKAKEYGLPTPKGFLQVGVPGCGKSLLMKATAKVLGVPLLKLDGGKIFGSLVGDSERNMRTAIQVAEAIAPCVLAIDELEKAFSGSKSSGSTDGGTSARVLGTFLQWMQDKTAAVFVVATANDISQLPPELLRRGRFDQLFFVDLPSSFEREEIWRIHIARFNRKPEDFNVSKLAAITDGFTGAEIESSVVDALFASFDAGREPSTDDFRTAAESTVPISKTMAEQIKAMREWSTGRALLASEPEVKVKKLDMKRKIA